MSDTYSYETEVSVRFRDLDPMNQVHNAAALLYAEEARYQFFRDVIGETVAEQNGAVVRQEGDYENPIGHDSAVTVRYRVARVGGTSVTTRFEVIADNAVSARGEVVHVSLDGDGDPPRIPREWRVRVREFEDAPVDGATSSGRRQ